MANCTISGGMGVDCSDLRRAGGVAKRFWIGNKDNIRASFNIARTSDITSIELTTYATLYKFEATKFSHTGTTDAAISDAGNVSFTQQFIAQMYNTSTADDLILESLSVTEVFLVVETNNKEFLIFGAAEGLKVTAMKWDLGKKPGDASTTAVTFEGSERTLPLRFLGGGTYDNALAILNAMSA